MGERSELARRRSPTRTSGETKDCTARRSTTMECGLRSQTSSSEPLPFTALCNRHGNPRIREQLIFAKLFFEFAVPLLHSIRQSAFIILESLGERSITTRQDLRSQNRSVAGAGTTDGH